MLSTKLDRPNFSATELGLCDDAVLACSALRASCKVKINRLANRQNSTNNSESMDSDLFSELKSAANLGPAFSEQGISGCNYHSEPSEELAPVKQNLSVETFNQLQLDDKVVKDDTSEYLVQPDTDISDHDGSNCIAETSLKPCTVLLERFPVFEQFSQNSTASVDITDSEEPHIISRTDSTSSADSKYPTVSTPLYQCAAAIHYSPLLFSNTFQSSDLTLKALVTTETWKLEQLVESSHTSCDYVLPSHQPCNEFNETAEKLSIPVSIETKEDSGNHIQLNLVMPQHRDSVSLSDESADTVFSYKSSETNTGEELQLVPQSELWVSLRRLTVEEIESHTRLSMCNIATSDDDLGVTKPEVEAANYSSGTSSPSVSPVQEGGLSCRSRSTPSAIVSICKDREPRNGADDHSHHKLYQSDIASLSKNTPQSSSITAASHASTINKSKSVEAPEAAHVLNSIDEVSLAAEVVDSLPCETLDGILSLLNQGSAIDIDDFLAFAKHAQTTHNAETTHSDSKASSVATAVGPISQCRSESTAVPGMRLVQLDGSPESSEHESDTEGDSIPRVLKRTSRKKHSVNLTLSNKTSTQFYASQNSVTKQCGPSVGNATQQRSSACVEAEESMEGADQLEVIQNLLYNMTDKVHRESSHQPYNEPGNSELSCPNPSLANSKAENDGLPSYMASSVVNRLAQVEQYDQTSNVPLQCGRKPAKVRRMGQTRVPTSKTPNAKSKPKPNLRGAQLRMALKEAYNSDTGTVVATLLTDMVNRTGCEIDHRCRSTCRKPICNRHFPVYLSQAEVEHSATNDSEWDRHRPQEDDVGQVVSDMMDEMLNLVVCRVRHTGVRKCKPGISCCAFKRIYRSVYQPVREPKKAAAAINAAKDKATKASRPSTHGGKSRNKHHRHLFADSIEAMNTSDETTSDSDNSTQSDDKSNIPSYQPVDDTLPEQINTKPKRAASLRQSRSRPQTVNHEDNSKSNISAKKPFHGKKLSHEKKQKLYKLQFGSCSSASGRWSDMDSGPSSLETSESESDTLALSSLIKQRRPMCSKPEKKVIQRGRGRPPKKKLSVGSTSTKKPKKITTLSTKLQKRAAALSSTKLRQRSATVVSSKLKRVSAASSSNAKLKKQPATLTSTSKYRGKSKSASSSTKTRKRPAAANSEKTESQEPVTPSAKLSEKIVEDTPTDEQSSKKPPELPLTEKPQQEQSAILSASAKSSSVKNNTSGADKEPEKEELPDLGLNIVLADSSESNDEDTATDPDSAGEINPTKRTLRRKKTAMSKEERAKKRQRLIQYRKASLARMGTPRSLVLCQLIQEEAQKKYAEIILPKNLPVYEPAKSAWRPFIFPLDLKLTAYDIKSIITDVYLGANLQDSSEKAAHLVSEICEVQSSNMVPDCQLMYQLCMFICTSESDSSILHRLLQKISQYSSVSDTLRCPLPRCNSSSFSNWSQVGAHLISHLPPAYSRLMSHSFRCPICWQGYPTQLHHLHHHQTAHSGLTYAPPVLTGFPSSQLLKLWTSPLFAQMFTGWSEDMMEDTRVPVADYTEYITAAIPDTLVFAGEHSLSTPPADAYATPSDTCPNITEGCPTANDTCPIPTVRCPTPSDRCPTPTVRSPTPTNSCSKPTEWHGTPDRCATSVDCCTMAADKLGLPTDSCPAPDDKCSNVYEPHKECSTSYTKEQMKDGSLSDGGSAPTICDQMSVTGCEQLLGSTHSGTHSFLTLPHSGQITADPPTEFNNEISGSTSINPHTQSLLPELQQEAQFSELESQQVTEPYELQTHIKEDPPNPQLVADPVRPQVDAVSYQPNLTHSADMPTEAPAFVCWYCARPFIGQTAFYIHILQEALAIPAAGVLSGCMFTDSLVVCRCYHCHATVSAHHMQSHLESEHPTCLHQSQSESDSSSLACPSLGCLARFPSYADLSDHLLDIHLPPDLQTRVSQQCTACSRVFKSHYSLKQHWIEQDSCAKESRADCFNVFEGHTLAHPYWTADLLCEHDLQLNKHNFSFCSTFQSASHVICWICQKLFNVHTEEMTLKHLSRSVKQLRGLLLDHLSSEHGFMVTTGVDHAESANLTSDYESETDETEEVPEIKKLSLPCATLKVRLENKLPVEHLAALKAAGVEEVADTRDCPIHHTAITTAPSGKRLCRMCRASYVWCRQLRKRKFYVKYEATCPEHGICSFLKHPNKPQNSFCESCAATPIANTSHTICYRHGPRQPDDVMSHEGKSKCRACKTITKVYPDSAPLSQKQHPASTSATKEDQSIEQFKCDTEYSFRCAAHPNSSLELGKSHVLCLQCKKVYKNSQNQNPATSKEICPFHQTEILIVNAHEAYCPQCADGDGTCRQDFRGVCTMHGLLSPAGHTSYNNCAAVCRICKRAALITVREWFDSISNGPLKSDSSHGYARYCRSHYKTVHELGASHVSCAKCKSIHEKYGCSSKDIKMENGKCHFHNLETVVVGSGRQYCPGCAYGKKCSPEYSFCCTICVVHGIMPNSGRKMARRNTDCTIWLCVICQSRLISDFQWYTLQKARSSAEDSIYLVLNKAELAQAPTAISTNDSEEEDEKPHSPTHLIMSDSATINNPSSTCGHVAQITDSGKDDARKVDADLPLSLRSGSTGEKVVASSYQPHCSLHPECLIQPGETHFQCHKCKEVYAGKPKEVDGEMTQDRCVIHKGIRIHKLDKNVSYCPSCAYGCKVKGTGRKLYCPLHGILIPQFINKLETEDKRIRVSCSLCKALLMSEKRYYEGRIAGKEMSGKKDGGKDGNDSGKRHHRKEERYKAISRDRKWRKKEHGKTRPGNEAPSLKKDFNKEARVSTTEIDVSMVTAGDSSQKCHTTNARQLDGQRSPYKLKCCIHKKTKLVFNETDHLTCSDCISTASAVRDISHNKKTYPRQVCFAHGPVVKRIKETNSSTSAVQLYCSCCARDQQHPAVQLGFCICVKHGALNKQSVIEHPITKQLLCCICLSRLLTELQYRAYKASGEVPENNRQETEEIAATNSSNHRLTCTIHQDMPLELTKSHVQCLICSKVSTAHAVNNRKKAFHCSVNCSIHSNCKEFRVGEERVLYCPHCAIGGAGAGSRVEFICPTHGALAVSSRTDSGQCKICEVFLLTEAAWYVDASHSTDTQLNKLNTDHSLPHASSESGTNMLPFVSLKDTIIPKSVPPVSATALLSPNVSKLPVSACGVPTPAVSTPALVAPAVSCENKKRDALGIDPTCARRLGSRNQVVYCNFIPDSAQPLGRSPSSMKIDRSRPKDCIGEAELNRDSADKAKNAELVALPIQNEGNPTLCSMGQSESYKSLRLFRRTRKIKLGSVVMRCELCNFKTVCLDGFHDHIISYHSTLAMAKSNISLSPLNPSDCADTGNSDPNTTVIPIAGPSSMPALLNCKPSKLGRSKRGKLVKRLDTQKPLKIKMKNKTETKSTKKNKGLTGEDIAAKNVLEIFGEDENDAIVTANKPCEKVISSPLNVQPDPFGFDSQNNIEVQASSDAYIQPDGLADINELVMPRCGYYISPRPTKTSNRLSQSSVIVPKAMFTGSTTLKEETDQRLDVTDEYLLDSPNPIKSQEHGLKDCTVMPPAPHSIYFSKSSDETVGKQVSVKQVSDKQFFVQHATIRESSTSFTIDRPVVTITAPSPNTSLAGDTASMTNNLSTIDIAPAADIVSVRDMTPGPATESESVSVRDTASAMSSSAKRRPRSSQRNKATENAAASKSKRDRSRMDSSEDRAHRRSTRQRHSSASSSNRAADVDSSVQSTLIAASSKSPANSKSSKSVSCKTSTKSHKKSSKTRTGQSQKKRLPLVSPSAEPSTCESLNSQNSDVTSCSTLDQNLDTPSKLENPLPITTQPQSESMQDQICPTIPSDPIPTTTPQDSSASELVSAMILSEPIPLESSIQPELIPPTLPPHSISATISPEPVSTTMSPKPITLEPLVPKLSTQEPIPISLPSEPITPEYSTTIMTTPPELSASDPLPIPTLPDASKLIPIPVTIPPELIPESMPVTPPTEPSAPEPLSTTIPEPNIPEPIPVKASPGANIIDSIPLDPIPPITHPAPSTSTSELLPPTAPPVTQVQQPAALQSQPSSSESTPKPNTPHLVPGAIHPTQLIQPPPTGELLYGEAASETKDCNMQETGSDNALATSNVTSKDDRAEIRDELVSQQVTGSQSLPMSLATQGSAGTASQSTETPTRRRQLSSQQSKSTDKTTARKSRRDRSLIESSEDRTHRRSTRQRNCSNKESSIPVQKSSLESSISTGQITGAEPSRSSRKSSMPAENTDDMERKNQFDANSKSILEKSDHLSFSKQNKLRSNKSESDKAKSPSRKSSTKRQVSSRSKSTSTSNTKSSKVTSIAGKPAAAVSYDQVAESLEGKQRRSQRYREKKMAEVRSKSKVSQLTPTPAAQLEQTKCKPAEAVSNPEYNRSSSSFQQQDETNKLCSALPKKSDKSHELPSSDKSAATKTMTSQNSQKIDVALQEGSSNELSDQVPSHQTPSCGNVVGDGTRNNFTKAGHSNPCHEPQTPSNPASNTPNHPIKSSQKEFSPSSDEMTSPTVSAEVRFSKTYHRCKPPQHNTAADRLLECLYRPPVVSSSSAMATTAPPRPVARIQKRPRISDATPKHDKISAMSTATGKQEMQAGNCSMKSKPDKCSGAAQVKRPQPEKRQTAPITATIPEKQSYFERQDTITYGWIENVDETPMSNSKTHFYNDLLEDGRHFTPFVEPVINPVLDTASKDAIQQQPSPMTTTSIYSTGSISQLCHPQATPNTPAASQQDTLHNHPSTSSDMPCTDQPTTFAHLYHSLTDDRHVIDRSRSGRDRVRRHTPPKWVSLNSGKGDGYCEDLRHDYRPPHLETNKALPGSISNNRETSSHSLNGASRKRAASQLLHSTSSKRPRDSLSSDRPSSTVRGWQTNYNAVDQRLPMSTYRQGASNYRQLKPNPYDRGHANHRFADTRQGNRTSPYSRDTAEWRPASRALPDSRTYRGDRGRVGDKSLSRRHGPESFSHQQGRGITAHRPRYVAASPEKCRSPPPTTNNASTADASIGHCPTSAAKNAGSARESSRSSDKTNQHWHGSRRVTINSNSSQQKAHNQQSIQSYRLCGSDVATNHCAQSVNSIRHPISSSRQPRYSDRQPANRNRQHENVASSRNQLQTNNSQESSLSPAYNSQRHSQPQTNSYQEYSQSQPSNSRERSQSQTNNSREHSQSCTNNSQERSPSRTNNNRERRQSRTNNSRERNQSRTNSSREHSQSQTSNSRERNQSRTNSTREHSQSYTSARECTQPTGNNRDPNGSRERHRNLSNSSKSSRECNRSEPQGKIGRNHCHSSKEQEEVVMTTYDGHIVRIKSTHKGTSKLA